MLNHQQLRRDYDALVRDNDELRFYELFAEGLRTGQIDAAKDLSITSIFEEFMPNGRELLREFDSKKRVNGFRMRRVSAMEANGAVGTTAFSNITGQIVYSVILQQWQNPQLLADSLVETVSTTFDGERIAGVGPIGDQALTVEEGDPYPTAGLNEQWVDTPRLAKKGMIVKVTKEIVLHDRTGDVLTQASRVGEALALNKEKRVLDTVFGVTTSYRRNGAAAAATYGDTPFDNLAASNSLVDWTDIENAELLFDAMTDPNTGEPITVMPDAIIVPTALRHTAEHILNATEVRRGSDPVTIGASPVKNSQYTILSSQYVKARTGSASTWFVGQPKKAFRYMEAWPISVVQAGVNSDADFNNDIVNQYKASEYGVPAVLEPRYMVKCTA